LLQHPRYEITPILIRPDLAIEVLSRDDEIQEMLTKVGDYRAAGIPHVWVIDPYERILVEADQAGIRRARALTLATRSSE
jgi:Uma2 family endonuclease